MPERTFDHGRVKVAVKIRFIKHLHLTVKFVEPDSVTPQVFHVEHGYEPVRDYVGIVGKLELRADFCRNGVSEYKIFLEVERCADTDHVPAAPVIIV